MALNTPMDSPHPHSSGALTSEQFRALSAARLRARKVRRASGIAAFSGWSLAVFAMFTFLGVVFGSVSSLVLGVGLSVIAWNELRGAGLLRRLDMRGPRVLGFNQIALGAMIFLYAGWSLIHALSTSSLASVGGSTGDARVDAMITEMSFLISVSLYSSVAVLGVVVPGLTAWYYFSRARLLRDLRAHTPDWVVETLRIAA